jgi:hypothetical protein
MSLTICCGVRPRIPDEPASEPPLLEPLPELEEPDAPEEPPLELDAPDEPLLELEELDTPEEPLLELDTPEELPEELDTPEEPLLELDTPEELPEELDTPEEPLLELDELLEPPFVAGCPPHAVAPRAARTHHPQGNRLRISVHLLNGFHDLATHLE